MPLSTGELRMPPRAVFASLIAAVLLTVAASLLAAGDGPGPGTAAAERGARPNFVVIYTDDQDQASLRVMKRTKKRIGRRGVKFTRNYATYPLCCPGRASYLTGRYSHNHGVRSNRAPDGGFQAFDDAQTVAVALDGDGYSTAWIGKFFNGYGAHAREDPGDLPDGFDRFFGALHSRMYDWDVNDQGRIRSFGRGARNYQTDVYRRKGKRFIREQSRAGRPFFLTIAPLAPHGEPKRDAVPNPRPANRHRKLFRKAKLPRPPSFNERNVSDRPAFIRRTPRLDRKKRRKERSRYRSRLASLQAVDEMVGDLIRVLRRRGELNNTYFVFTSDNGYMLGEHRHTGKTLLYEESGTVPLLVRGPRVARGKVHREPVGNIDLMPTILDLANADTPALVDGVSLRRVFRRPGRRTDRILLVENKVSTGVQTRRYTYLEHDTGKDGGADEYELYDTLKDPFQLRNLHDINDPVLRPRVASERPGLVAKRNALAAELAARRDCAGSTCR